MSSPSTTSFLGAIRKGIGTGLAVAGAGALLSSALLAAVRYRAAQADAQLPAEYVLELPLDRLQLVDATSLSPLGLVTGDTNKVELPRVVSALRQAAADTRCRGVVTYLGAGEHLGGLASAQELRGALAAFRTSAAGSGRQVTTAAFAASFGEAGSSGMLPYLVATGCEHVYMQPSGTLGLTGLESRGFFARGLLERLRARPLILAREEFKSAANFLREKGFTSAQRENMTSVLGDMAEQMITAMGSGRGVAAEAVRQAIDEAPLLPAAATSIGLLDGMKYKDEVQSLFRISPGALREERARPGAKHQRREDDVRMARVPVDKYIRLVELKEAAAGPGWLAGAPFKGLALLWPGAGQQQQAKARKLKVAVVTAVGPIVQGPVQPGPLSQGQVIDAAKLSRQLAALLEDPAVGAVVLRVSSPGGSALASDNLHHEISRLRAAGKKVVVSMGDVAASGGYYLAAAADRIVAQPGTLTGSIGVLYGKVDVSASLQEVGVNTEGLKVGRNADALSPFTGLSPEQEAQLEAMMDHVYLDFLDKVSRSRGRPVEEIRPLAKGRVYTGRQALDVGLVDELGGLETAVQSAKQLAGLPEDAEVMSYPPRRVPLLLQLLRRSGAMRQPGDGDGDGSGLAAATAAVAAPRQFAEALHAAEEWGPLAAALGAMVLGSGGAAGGGAAGAVADVVVAAGLPGSGLLGSGAGAHAGGSLALLTGRGPQLYSAEAAMLARV